MEGSSPGRDPDPSASPSIHRTRWRRGQEVRTTYNAAVEVATKTPLDVEQVSELSDYRPQVGTSPRGWLEVRLSLTATSLAHACATALAVASAATGAEAIACEVM